MPTGDERRQKSSKPLKVKAFIKKATYVKGSGPDSNKRLEQALELASQAPVSR